MKCQGTIKEKLHIIYKIAAGILILSLLCGCNVQPPVKQNIRIVVSTYPIYEWVSAITKNVDSADISYIVFNDIHNYELTEKDKEDIKACDLFIYAGGPSDKKLEEALKTKDPASIVNLIKVSKDEGTLKKDDADQYIDDEHIWLSISIAQSCLSYIADRISALDKENDTKYLENATAYIERLNDLKSDYTNVFGEHKDDVLIFADAFPFAQMVNEFKCNYIVAGDICPNSNYNGYNINEIREAFKEKSVVGIITIGKAESDTVKMLKKTAGYDIPVYKLYSVEKPEQTEYTSSEEASYYSLMYDNLLQLEDLFSKKGTNVE